jgi:predicted DNA-binding transcriptional regulator YafY
LIKPRWVGIWYTNYKAEKRFYIIIPHTIEFSKNDFHKEEQWLLTATDVERNVLRSFAMKDIHSWRKYE